MKKNLLRRFFATVMLLAITTLTWAYDFTINGIYYNKNSDGTSVTVTYESSSYNSYSGSVAIPSQVTYNSKTYEVTSIGEYAFRNCSGLTSVTIPNSVTSIGEYAFYKCSGLTSVTIPNSVTSIGIDAFYGCSGLTSITIPNSVTSIGGGAFWGCSGLTSVTIGNSVTSIGSSAFSGCSGLTSVTIPNSVTSIGSSAFSGCTSLTSVTIPNSVTSIGNQAFYNCSGLTSVTIPNSVTSIGNYAFYKCTSLTSVTIPNSVTSIGSSAFSGCSGLTSVTIPNSVTSISGSAFSGCSGLTSVNIGNSVTSIGDKAFYGCSGLTSVTLNANDIVSKTYSSSSNLGTIFGSQVKEYVLGDDVKGIGNYAFYGCSGLTSVTIGNSVTSIGSSAFRACSSLTSVTIPNSVTSIGSSAFFGCSGLTSVTIPNSVTSIGQSAFSGCSGLTSVTIPNSVTSISGSAFSGCSGLTSVTIPNSVTSIGSSAFSGCSGLTSVTIPNSVTSIGSSAFSGCSGLTSVTIPNSVTSISGSAFSGCSGLTSVTIGNSVTSIGDYVFYGCSGLTSVTLNANDIVSKTYSSSSNLGTIFGSQVKEFVLGDDVKGIGNYAFYGCGGLTSVTIPNSVTSIGQSAFSGCSGLTKAEFASIESFCKITFGNSLSNPLYYAKHLYINGQEVIDVVIPNSVTSIGQSAFSGCSGLTSVTIPNSVTSIGQSAFSGCSGLTSVTLNANDIVSKTYSSSSNLGTIFGSQVKEFVLGDDVKGIGNYAFSGCGGLTSVTIPSSVTSIGDYAFSNCGGLTSVTIPNSVTSIGQSAFSGCGGLTSVTLNANDIVSKTYSSSSNLGTIFGSQVKEYVLGDDVKGIGNYAFSGCGGLTSVTIPNSVTSIGNAAFSGCSGLTSITIPNSVTSIENSAFSGCSGLTSITIPNSVTSIGGYAFYGCSGLTSVTIPNSVTSIGEYAFYGCSGLTSVTIPNSVTSIGNYAFLKCSGLTSVTLNANDIVSKTYSSSSNIKTLFGSQVTEYILGDDIKSIGNYAFYNCSSLTSVTIPNSVTSIGASAFYNCSGLTSITIPNSVTSIGNSVFYNCSSLTSVNIPNSVTSIGASAFYNCSGLTKAEFENIERLCKMNFESINSNPLYYAKHLYINGQEVTDLVIPNSVTSIGNYVFGNCTGLKSIYIPESITSIGNSTFYNCSGLTSITIPNSVTSIGSNAFSGCNSLTSVTLNTNDIVSKTYTSSSNINTIFGSQVKEYIIGDDITSIGDYAFYGCSGLSSATIGNNVTKIGNYAFNNCPSLTSITIPDGVTTIRSSSFPNSTKKYVNKGSLALLAAWKSGIIPYDLTTEISLEKPTIKYSSTQTTVTVNVSPIYDGFTYLIDDVYYVEKEDDKITFDGLVPGGSKDIKLNVSLGEFSYSTTCYVSTQDMKQNVSLVKRSASSFEINGNYTKGDAEVVSESLTVNDITKTGHTAIFTGLRPQKTYYVKYNVTVKHGEETYTCTRGFDISTEALTFTTTQPKVISLGNAVVGATSNLDDAEENVGFEWRRTDWTDDFASNTGAAYLYEGTMEGYIRNLYTEKLWKVRPYYKSNDGKFYYGEWVGLDPTNTSYFEPTVHTYARIDQTENKVQISGYVQRGTDDVSKQGFKYWVQEDNARGAGISIPSGAKTVEADGRVMEVELTGLKPNTTYAYVAFVTTTEGETFYGKQLSFTTGDDPEASVTGDANGNGEVEIGDVTSVLTLMATPEATGYNNKAADANGNGEIEIGDVTTILTIMAGN